MVQWSGKARVSGALVAVVCALAVPATAQAGDFSVDADGAVAAFAVTTDGADTLRVREGTGCPVGVPCMLITGIGGTTVTYVETGAQPNHQCQQDDPVTVTCIAGTVAGDLGALNDSIFGDGPIRFVVDGGDGNDSLGASDTHAVDDVLSGGAGVDLLDGEDGNDQLDGGDGDDKVNPGSGDDTIDGGAGDDELHGYDGNDVVTGGGGQDRLYGGAGNDQLDGGDGDDELEKAIGDTTRGDIGGADVYRGGPGFDALNLEGVSGNRTITLGDGPNDGTSGEGDDVGADLESIRGGFGNDTITGDGNANVLIGDRGDDTIRGGGGNDVLDGREDTDQVFGEAGDDTVRGGSGADVIDGGGGTDVLEADIVGCQNLCDNGNDVVNARDGIQEQISCGGGADRLIADALDIAPTDAGQICESIERDGTGAPVPSAGTPGTGTPSGTTNTTAPQPAITTLRIIPGNLGRLLRSGLVVAVPCAATRCVVTLDVRQGGRRIGSGTRTLSKGGGKVTARFTAAARRRLARTRKLTLTVRVRSRSGDTTRLTTKRVTVRR